MHSIKLSVLLRHRKIQHYARELANRKAKDLEVPTANTKNFWLVLSL